MDRKLPEKALIEQLIRRSASARACLENEAAVLRKRLDIPDRLRSSMSSHPTGWLLGSLGSGLVASTFFRRRSRATKSPNRRILPGLLGLLLTLVKPVAKILIINFVKDWMFRQTLTASGQRSNPRSHLF